MHEKKKKTGTRLKKSRESQRNTSDEKLINNQDIQRD